MRLTANAIAAVLGWTALVLLVFAPGPLPIVAMIVALALLVGCLASLLLTAVWCGVLRGLLVSGSTGRRLAERVGGSSRP
jgi:hypothetical protein